MKISDLGDSGRWDSHTYDYRFRGCIEELSRLQSLLYAYNRYSEDDDGEAEKSQHTWTKDSAVKIR